MMMKKIIFIIVIVLLSVVAIAQQNTLSVSISGIKDVKGNIYVYLYTSEEGFPMEIEQAISFKKIRLTKTSVTTNFIN